MKPPIVSIDELNNYINNYEEDMNEIKEQIIRSAEEVVEDFLGWDVQSHMATETHMATRDGELPLRCRNITEVNYVEVNGEECTDDFEIIDDVLIGDFKKGDKVKVEYIGGYQVTRIPPLVKQTVLRIAGLMYAEVGGAIGLSSRQSADGSKTYISYSNYSKYLEPLSSYRKIRF